MARDYFRIEKGLHLTGENAETGVKHLFGSGAPSLDAEIGSIYADTDTGSHYVKKVAGAGAGNWSRLALTTDITASIGTWRPESVVLTTGEVQGAGTRDVVASPFTDDDGTAVAIGEYVVGKHVITDADGTPALLEISAVSGNDVTFVAAAAPLVSGDTFVTKYYLPDTPDDQEGEAIVNFNGSVMVKIGDINWAIADGIALASAYAATNGSISNADTVNSAIEKLDGNQADIQTALGIAQGDVDFSTFTGSTIPDNSDAKEAFQALETAHETTDGKVSDLITLTGVSGNSTNLGAFSGDIIVDNSDIKTALQALETELVDTRDNTDDLITLSGVAENATDLGSFTGVTIPDGSDIKEALQAIETSHETASGKIDDLITLSGVSGNSTDLGAFSGDIIVDNSDVKTALQALETELVDTRDNTDDLITLSGVAENATDLGSFTGATIPDGSDVKEAFQAIETAHETTDGKVADLITLSGVSGNSTDLGAFTGDIIVDNSDVKTALQALETELVDTRDNTDDLITLSGVAENATDFGTFTGVSFADSQDAKELFQRIETLLEQMRGVQATAITAEATVDSVPVASVKTVKWLVEAFEEATPANIKSLEIFALTDGSTADNTVYARLSKGSNFNLTITVDVSGGNMRLRAASTTAGVTVTARRIEVVKSVL